MRTEWTEAQKQVIHHRGSNLLVSAAAGSGKTAVLVEHIIQQVLDRENPVDIDNMLVVTFTNAAAGEMKERIRTAIEEAIETQPENQHLQRQLSYIHNARITTLHSFCLNLVREHFDVLDIDPAFRIADSGETELLKSDVVKEVMEEFYASQREDFHELIEQLTGKNDKMMEEYIQSFYECACSNVNPQKWIRDMASQYGVNGEEELHFSVIREHLDMVLEECMALYEGAIERIQAPGGPVSYKERIWEECESVKAALKEMDYEKKCAQIAAISFPVMRSSKDGSQKEAKEAVKALRDEAKKKVKELQSCYAGIDRESFLEVIQKLREPVEVFAEITIAFAKRFSQRKRERNILDFNDIEHMALQILCGEEEGGLFPSKVADEIAMSIQEVIVDEYQDINQVQDTILNAVCAQRFGRANLFMVGDVKQSIYGFRKAEPELFMKKFAAFDDIAESESESRKIVLDRNFRSRREVIDGINMLFRRIMYKEVGGIDYEGENELYPGADYPNQPESQDGTTELLIAVMPKEIESDTDEEGNYQGITKKQLEARMTAKRIKELVDAEHGYQVYDHKLQAYRRAEYRDILILLRSTRKNAEIYMQELMGAGIPVYYEQQTGYFDAVEVNQLLSFLNVIDNPHQDIELAASLKSVFGHITERELAMIRMEAQGGGDLYEDVVRYLSEGESEELLEKLETFMQRLDEYRKKAVYTSIHDLITYIIEDTGYDNYVMAMPAGERRSANVQMLKQKALDYENGSYKGLFHFVRYIEKVRKYEIESGEASVVSEHDNIVRIMSIHKSKGLEFPIVFLCNANGMFNDMDSKKAVLIHKKYGIGMDYINRENRVRRKGYYKDAIKMVQRKELREEELRVLYVALTRAKEKLIITASGVNTQKYTSRMVKKHVSRGSIIGANSYLDFIGYALGKELETGTSFLKISYVPVEKLVLEEVKKRVSFAAEEKYFRHWDDVHIYSREARQKIMAKAEYEYPYPGATKHYAKVSVSELKHKKMEEDERSYSMFSQIREERIVPDFVKRERGELQKKLSGASKGTAYHRVFELYDFGIPEEEEAVKTFLRTLYEEGKLDELSYNSVEVKDILAFVRSNLGQRMKRAAEQKKLYREVQFVMGVEGKTIYEAAEGDLVLLQGIIDVYFEEEDGLVLADYKTDRVSNMEELKGRYREQLEQYQTALNQITGKRVKEKIIYSVTLSEEGKV